jgi:riboflavin synthase
LFTGIVEDLGEVEAIDHQGDFARIYVRSSVVTSDARPGDSICVSGVCLTVTGLFSVSPGGDDPPQTPPAHGGATRPPIPPGPPGGGLEPPVSTGPASAGPVGFTADVMGETLRHSSLKSLSPGTKVNLERSVRLEDRLGGHLVQGHTDGTGTIQSRVSHADWDVVRVSLPASLARYVVHKGSITVDGVSLTVSEVSPGGDDPPQTPPAHGGHLPPIPPGGGQQPPDPPGGAGDWFEISLIPETLKRTTLGTKQPGDEVNLEVDVIAKYVEKLIGGTR